MLERILLCSHVIHICMGLTNDLSHGFTWKSGLLEIQMKYKQKTSSFQKYNFVLMITFDVLDGFL